MAGIENKLATLFCAWLDTAMPQRQGMALAKVESASSDAQGGYRCSVSLLEPETLKETGDQLEDVVICSIGHSTGLWVLPAVGQIVVIGYLAMDKSMPLILGCYNAGAPVLQEQELLLQTEGGASIKLDAAGLIAIKNQNESLKGLLMELIDDLSGLKTIPAAVGSALTLAPDNIAKIQSYKGRLLATCYWLYLAIRMYMLKIGATCPIKYYPARLY